MSLEEPSTGARQNRVANLQQVSVDSVQAELVRMYLSASKDIKADEVDLQQSAAFEANAANMNANLSALGIVQSAEITLQNSVVGAVRADNVILTGASGAIIADKIEFGNITAGWIAGREVKGEKIESVLLISPKVEGNVTTILDTRGVIIAGLISGLFTGMILLLGRALFGRK